MNNKKNEKPELIAPAGNLEKMKTAFAFGADAVYAGIPDFSLRVRINDFDVKSLKKAIEYAHNINKKVYVTINIFAHNKHFKKLPAYVRELKKAKPDGFIVSDPGVMMAIRKVWPSAKMHLSTQANCVNKEAAKFWFEQGFKRIVLGRETTIREIKEIKKSNPKLEIEAFVHGAMCMAYSGRCFLSKLFTGRSANLGDCVQPCRWKYNAKITNSKLQIPNKFKIQNPNVQNYSQEIFIKAEGRDEALELVEEEHGSYILNSNDLCLIKRIPEMVDAGISSFKIEGRAKSVYYLACVVGAYRKAIDAVCRDEALPRLRCSSCRRRDEALPRLYEGDIDFLHKELDEKLYHRGYTEGFMFGNGKMAQNLDNSHKTPEWEFCGAVIGEKTAKRPAAPRLRGAGKNKKTKHSVNIKIHNTLKVGDRIEIIMPGYDIIKMKLKSMVDAETGEELEEAHGGQGKVVVIESNVEIPEFSVVRRKM